MLTLENGIYKAISKGEIHSYIVKVENNRSKECIDIKSNPANYHTYTEFSDQWGTYTPANHLDAEWLENCIEAKKLVERPSQLVESHMVEPQINNSYEIF